LVAATFEKANTYVFAAPTRFNTRPWHQSSIYMVVK
jgi:hypothetical protein